METNLELFYDENWQDSGQQSTMFLEEIETAAYEIFVDKDTREKLPLFFMETSPFIPNKPGPKAKLKEKVVIENRFGRIILTGEELVVFDEDILLAILCTKKKIINGDYYYITSLRELAKLTGTVWRGAKNNASTGQIIGSSTSKQLLQSLNRLWNTGLIIQNHSTQRDYRLKFIEFLDTPSFDKNGEMMFAKGEKEQLRIRISKEFLHLYSTSKIYTIRLEDRIKIKDLIGKALYRYIKYLTTFKHKGIHQERLKLLITKINWELPSQIKDGNVYVRWQNVKEALQKASAGLKNVGIVLEFPDKLDEDSTITIKKLSFHQPDLI